MTLRAYHLLLALFGLTGAAMSTAETVAPATPAPLEVQAPVLTDAELEELVGPIALHPDALVALILPAATSPSDIVLAVRQLASGAAAAAVEEEPWDDSIKALVRYPEMLRWLDENLAWTKRLGEAFLLQPADVMNAIQRLRAKARVAGTLRDTQQQRVVVEEEEIRIVPARTEVIYVPRYNPAVVYVDRPVYASHAFVSFGIGYTVGHWLAYDCDWRRRTICYVPRHHRSHVWRERRDWRNRIYPMRGHHHWRDDRWHAWRPSHRHRYRDSIYERSLRHSISNRVHVQRADVSGMQSLGTGPASRTISGWRQHDRRDGYRINDRDHRQRHWERPGRAPHGNRSPRAGSDERPAVRSWQQRNNLPSGPSVRPAPSLRSRSEIVRPAPDIVKPQARPSIVRPQPRTSVVRPQGTPSVVQPRSSSSVVRPQSTPSVVRPRSGMRSETVRAPNGRVISGRDGSRVSGRGERVRAPGGRWMPAP